MTITGKNPILKSFVLLAPNSKNPKSSNLVSPDFSLALKCSYACSAALNCARIAKILNSLNSLFVIFVNKNFAPVVAEISKEKKSNSETIAFTSKMSSSSTSKIVHVKTA